MSRHCSFCGRVETECQPLIASAADPCPAICDKCIEIAAAELAIFRSRQIIAERDRAEVERWVEFAP